MNSINKYLRESLFRSYIERNKNRKEQKLFDIIFGTVFIVCILSFMAALVLICALQNRAGIIMLGLVLVCFIVTVGYALFRKKRIMKKLFPISIGSENIEKIYINNPDFLDHLYAQSALTMGIEGMPDAEFFNIVYNWLNGLKGLRNGNLKLYLFQGTQLNQKFNCKIGDDTQIICISKQDLDINKENAEQFSIEHMIFGRYLNDIIDNANR